MNFNDFQKRTKKFYSGICSCMYVDENLRRCTNRPISSHSLQKSKTLKGIAEKGHVIGLGHRFSPTEAVMEFKKIGYTKASTFPGYCKKHDGEFFSDIEDTFSGFSDRALESVRSSVYE